MNPVDSPVYTASYALAAAVGIDLAIEIQADLFDSLIFPGVGDVLRNVWREIRADLVRTPARLSGAAHELEFYGDSVTVTKHPDHPGTPTNRSQSLPDASPGQHGPSQHERKDSR